MLFLRWGVVVLGFWVGGLLAQTRLTPDVETRVDAPSRQGGALIHAAHEAQKTDKADEADEADVADELAAHIDLQLQALRAQKLLIEQNYEQQHAACLKKFAVTGCKREAVDEKNALMGAVKKQEAQLAEQQKRLRSEQKLRDLAKRQSPEELERIQVRTRAAQQAFEERQSAHEERLADHARQLNTPAQALEPLSAEQKAKDRQASAKSAQDVYEQKIRAAKEHREELRKRLETKTLHLAPLALPENVQAPNKSVP